MAKLIINPGFGKSQIYLFKSWQQCISMTLQFLTILWQSFTISFMTMTSVMFTCHYTTNNPSSNSSMEMYIIVWTPIYIGSNLQSFIITCIDFNLHWLPFSMAPLNIGYHQMNKLIRQTAFKWYPFDNIMLKYFTDNLT